MKAAPPGSILLGDGFVELASPSAVNMALSRLVRRGALDRVRRGNNPKPLSSRFGRGSAAAEEVALLSAGGKAPGPAGPSAAAALGLSTQVPPHPTVAVVGRPPTSVPNVRFVERSNLERVAARLGPLDVAVLEILRDDLAWVEVSRSDVAARIRKLVRADRIDARRLRHAAKGEPRRVRVALEALLSAS